MLAVLVLQLLGCSLFSSGGDGPSGPPPALVRVASVEKGDLSEAWSALAEVKALDSAELSVGASGTVSKVTVREGDRVERDHRLLEIDTRLAVARLRAANAAVQEAEVELDRRQGALRRRRQVAEGVLPAEELHEARAAVEIQQARIVSLQAAASEARAVLARHRVTAPFPGVVRARHVDPGDWVTSGQTVLELVSTEAVEVRTNVPREVVDKLTPGLEVGIAGGTGVLIAVVPTLDPNTRTALVRIAPADDVTLRAGQHVDVALPIKWEGLGVRVPRDAVLFEPKRARVLEVVDGKAVSVTVEVLARGQNAVLVRADELAIGDQIITRGNERVRPGQAVRVEPAEAAASGVEQ